MKYSEDLKDIGVPIPPPLIIRRDGFTFFGLLGPKERNEYKNRSHKVLWEITQKDHLSQSERNMKMWNYIAETLKRGLYDELNFLDRGTISLAEEKYNLDTYEPQ